jgi:ribonuclease HI
MRDQWLQRDSGMKITALKKNSKKRMVSQLMNTEGKSWNVSLLQELFLEHDVQAIQSIQIPPQAQCDRIAWHYESNRVFTVKSAYRLAMKLKHQNRDNVSSSTNADGERSLWNCIWKSRVPPKVRVFAWRLATNTLPTKTNKLSRKLEVCDRCDICGRDAEDAYHAVVRCTKANGLRYALRKHWKLPHEHTFRKTGKDWLLILLNQVDMDTGARILLMFWRAWHLRNNIVHDNGKETIERSISFLLSYATAHENLDVCADDKGKTPMWSSKENGDGASLGGSTGGWDAPPQGWIKLNTDASFISADHASGGGAVARDSNGVVLFAACSPIRNCSDAVDAEAKAALRGIDLAFNLGHTRVILELDCAGAVSALRSVDIDRSKQWATYDHAKSILKSLDDHRIIHTRRESNRVADALAKMARSAGSCIWWSQLPDIICDLVTQDQNSIVYPII